MNTQNKENLLCALEKQKSNFSYTTQEQYEQVMRMNGWTSVKKVSLAELLSSNGRSKLDSRPVVNTTSSGAEEST